MHDLALFLQDNNQPSPEMLQHILMAMAFIFPILTLLIILILMVPCWFICKKAGFSPWLSLLCIIPTLGMVVLLYVLAFADWKVLPAPQASYPPPYPPPPPSPPYPQA